MDLNEIRAFLGEDWTRTEAFIRSRLESGIELLDTTNTAILSSGGKQLRPMLSLLIARACGGGRVNSDSISYAAACELLHNATLLHDDVADESDRRRGMPTVRSYMGPQASVLVGDYWLVRAVDSILDSATLNIDVVRAFARTLRDLAEGEMLQLQKAQSGDTTYEDYIRIIYNKTASLFEAVAFSAAVSVGASTQVREAACEYARNLGLAFQIRDDIFDYSPGMDIGKPVGADILEGKITLPLLEAFGNATVQEEESVRAMVRDIAAHPENREAICRFVAEKNGLARAQERLGEFAAASVRSLDVFEASPEKEYLRKLSNFVGNRKI